MEEWTGPGIRPPYRDGKVHVCAAKCPTCIFRPGNLMRLEAGRVQEMVQGALADDSAIICHDTLDGDQAVCRGFHDAYSTTPLQLAERLGMLVEIDSPRG